MMANRLRSSVRVAWAVALACGAATIGAGVQRIDRERSVQTVTVEKTTPQPSAPAPKTQKPRAHEALEFKQCDANIEVRAATTTCEFAQNVFWHYWTEGQSPSLSVWSPAAGATLSTSCTATGSKVSCTTADRGLVRFSQAAVDSYSAGQADAYAGSHNLGPDPQTEPSEPEPDPSAESASPDTGDPGENIPSYDEGRGYRVQCNDGMYSKSGGIQGACSGHGEGCGVAAGVAARFCQHIRALADPVHMAMTLPRPGGPRTRGAQVLAEFLPLHEEHAPMGFGERPEAALLTAADHLGEPRGWPAAVVAACSWPCR